MRDKMPNQTLISIFIISLLIVGCSSDKQKVKSDIDETTEQVIEKTGLSTGVKQQGTKKMKAVISPLTDEMRAELKDILDRNLTEEDWEKIKETNKKYGNSFDESDIGTQMFLIFNSSLVYDNPNLQKELEDFFSRQYLRKEDFRRQSLDDLKKLKSN